MDQKLKNLLKTELDQKVKKSIKKKLKKPASSSSKIIKYEENKTGHEDEWITEPKSKVFPNGDETDLEKNKSSKGKKLKKSTKKLKKSATKPKNERPAAIVEEEILEEGIPSEDLMTEQKKNTIIELMLMPETMKILNSDLCPVIRDFIEHKPENINEIDDDDGSDQGGWYDNNKQKKIKILPFDQYRKIDEYGIESPPRDVNDNTIEGRYRYVRDLLEANARNLIRVNVLQRRKMKLQNYKDAYTKDKTEDPKKKSNKSKTAKSNKEIDENDEFVED
jgi:hypothetical protein